jgi:aminoglycoside phosphotransferase (APT) family kinase protein
VILEHVAAIPGRDGASVVVIDGRLPSITADTDSTRDGLDAFEPLVGRPIFLRIGALVDSQILIEFDRGDGDTVPLADAKAEQLAPPALQPRVAQWLAEQRGSPVDPRRPVWARPGWHARAEAWVGRPLSPHRVWPLAAVLQSDGEFFKAVFPLFHHEPAVTRALAERSPGDVPDVVRTDEPEGWLLTRDVRGSEADDRALETLERIQHAWRNRADELLALGAPNRRLHVLERQVARLVADIAPEYADHVLSLERACRELGRGGEPETIVHGDFHRGNALIAEDGRAVILDWSDACIGHPSFDRHLFRSEHETAETIPASLHQAVSYREILARMEPDDRWRFATAPRHFLDLAVAALS